MQFFASFIIAPHKDGIAATTRAADRGEKGRIGLPGGKIDAGESARAAAIREAAEEGWNVFFVSEKPIHTAIVDGKPVAWFTALYASPKKRFKEQHRIQTVTTSREVVANSGYGNGFIATADLFLTGRSGIRGGAYDKR